MTYTISWYPVHLIDVLEMAGGRRVTIRPTLPQDLDLQRAFFRALSPFSRYCRFMTGVGELPETLVERFANVDYSRHLALLAEVTGADGRRTMIGEARYVITEDDPASCEFPICVADEWHSRGVAQALLAQLERQAAASGIRKMVADTLIVNEPMRRLATRVGYAIGVVSDDYEIVRLEKVLATPSRTSRQPLAA